MLFVSPYGLAWYANQQRLEAQSRALSARAEQILPRDRPAALDLAIRSWHTTKTAEANLAVADAFPRLLAKLEGHSGPVRRASFSPDGQRIVTGSDDPTARVWNAANWRLLFRLEGHTGDVNEAAFSPDGQRNVTASRDSTSHVNHVVLLSGIADLLRK